MMTEPADIDKRIAATSRRGFLREGGALMGGAVQRRLGKRHALLGPRPVGVLDGHGRIVDQDADRGFSVAGPAVILGKAAVIAQETSR